jgi:hypothetical protein
MAVARGVIQRRAAPSVLGRMVGAQLACCKRRIADEQANT